jgi:hypothetical protein
MLRKTRSARDRRKPFHRMIGIYFSRAPDLLGSRLAVFQFTDAEKRQVVVRFVDAADLLDFDELQQRLEETYKLWFDVLEGREEEARRAAGALCSGG